MLVAHPNLNLFAAGKPVPPSRSSSVDLHLQATTTDSLLTMCSQLIEVRDLSNSVVKTINPPVQMNEIFHGGTASLILSSTTSVILYDIQQQKTIAEVNRNT